MLIVQAREGGLTYFQDGYYDIDFDIKNNKYDISFDFNGK